MCSSGDNKYSIRLLSDRLMHTHLQEYMPYSIGSNACLWQLKQNRFCFVYFISWITTAFWILIQQCTTQAVIQYTKMLTLKCKDVSLLVPKRISRPGQSITSYHIYFWFTVRWGNKGTFKTFILKAKGEKQIDLTQSKIQMFICPSSNMKISSMELSLYTGHYLEPEGNIMIWLIIH